MPVFSRMAKTFLFYVLVIPAVFVIALVAQQITPLIELDVYLNTHERVRNGFVALFIVLTVAGFLLLIFSQFVPGPTPGEREAEVRDVAPYAYREQSTGLGRSFSGVTSLSSMKEAWRNRDWRRDEIWRMIFLMGLGAALGAIGLFGLFFVIGPPAVKLICGTALIYMFVRTIWGFLKA